MRGEFCYKPCYDSYSYTAWSMVTCPLNSFYPVDEYTRPQAIAPRDRGRVYSSSTVVCISLLLNRFKVLFGSLYPHIRFRWWLSIFATCFDGLSLCFCVRNHEFFAMASARPRRYTAEQATEFIMNYDSDENDYDVASFLLCSVFYCPCVVYCVCVVYCFFLCL